MKNKGLHTHRFRREPDEEAAAVEWEKTNRLSRTLDHLLGDGQKPAIPSARDREVAATVIQWLGSPVGQGFLEDLGYTKSKPTDF